MPEFALTANPAPAVEMQPIELRSFDDIDGLRERISTGVLAGLSNRFPIENERYRLELQDIQHAPKTFSIRDQKQAILTGRTLSTPVKGIWRLVDRSTGEAVDQAVLKSMKAAT